MNVRKTERIAYILKDITEYGKFVAYCINHDICVFRTYWDEREKDRCFQIDWENKKCFYSSRRYYESYGYEFVEPNFYVDEYGNWIIK